MWGVKETEIRLFKTEGIASLEMVGIVGEPFGPFTVSTKYYSEHLTCVNLFLPITTLRGN